MVRCGYSGNGAAAVPIPHFERLMLPVLRLAGDGREHSLEEAHDHLAASFRLTSAERNLSVGWRQSRFGNRLGWAVSFLQQAGLLSRSRRRHFEITDRGRQLLADPPVRIDTRFLESYPEFVEFWKELGREHARVKERAAEAGRGDDLITARVKAMIKEHVERSVREARRKPPKT
jgi:restriction system protein